MLKLELLEVNLSKLETAFLAVFAFVDDLQDMSIEEKKGDVARNIFLSLYDLTLF